MNIEDRVKLLYWHLLGREADTDGLAHWTAQANRDGNLGLVAGGILESEEYAARVHAAEARIIPSAALSTCLKSLGRDLLIVDIGAQRLNYENHVYAALMSTDAYRIIGFEPLKDRLDERLSMESDKRLSLLPHFVGDGSEQLFHINNFDATSSLLPLNNEVTQLFSELHVLKTERSVSAKTQVLDSLLADTDPVDFLKLDIQGFELNALRGAERVLQRTNVVHCEVEFCPIYSEQPLFSEIEIFLRQRGFELIDIVRDVRGSYRVPSGRSTRDRLLFAEAVFFKIEKPVAYVAQALIAWMVYGKFGLARHLLKLHNEQNRTTLAPLSFE